MGVDGGGTRTRAVVIDEEGRELARAERDGAVVTAIRPQDAAGAVREAVSRALDEAGLAPPVDVLWAGLAGAGAPGPRAGVTRALRALDLAERLIVGTDVEAAFHDAFDGGAGVLLIAGTGSVVWVRDDGGEEHRVGGWGQVLGDEGSGYWIGLQGLRTLLRSEDGRSPATAMTEPLLGACEVSGPEELVSWIEDATKGEVAALAPTVIGCADDGDPGAAEIVDGAVHHLEGHIATAVRRLEEAGPAPSVDVVLWGGLVAPGGPLRERMATVLKARGLGCDARPVDPPMGAAHLARATVSG